MLVTTMNGLSLEMKHLKTYSTRKVFFHQDRICVTDLNNNEILSLDLIGLGVVGF